MPYKSSNQSITAGTFAELLVHKKIRRIYRCEKLKCLDTKDVHSRACNSLMLVQARFEDVKNIQPLSLTLTVIYILLVLFHCYA